MSNKPAKKVLSLDLDIIVWECIELYNNDVGNYGGNFWDEIEKDKHLRKFLYVDEKLFLRISKLIQKIGKKLPAENIFFALEHDMILEFLCADPAKKDMQFEVFNIDHHHDIYYNNQQKEHVDRFDYACLSDWIYYLGKNDKLKKYHWIHDAYSKEFPEDQALELEFPYTRKLYEEAEESLMAESFDYLFICLSKDYMPVDFWHYFYSLKDKMEKEKGIGFPVWEKDYCLDGKTRHVL